MRADEAHAFQWRRLYQFVIQGGERQSLALSELKINSIIETQPVRPRERQHGSVLGQGRMIDRETFEDPKKTRRVIFRKTPAPLSCSATLRTSNHQCSGTSALSRSRS